jgi:hypothetical protein
MPDPVPQDLARYLAASTGLPPSTAVRVIAPGMSERQLRRLVYG